jgi:hypothetical protein
LNIAIIVIQSSNCILLSQRCEQIHKQFYFHIWMSILPYCKIVLDLVYLIDGEWVIGQTSTLQHLKNKWQCCITIKVILSCHMNACSRKIVIGAVCTFLTGTQHCFNVAILLSKCCHISPTQVLPSDCQCNQCLLNVS